MAAGPAPVPGTQAAQSWTSGAKDLVMTALVLIGISVVFVRQIRPRPYLLMGWLWFLGTLVPVIGLVQASQLLPSIFIAQDPHTPSRQERRKVSVVSISFLILIRASSTIGPHVSRSMTNLSRRGRADRSGSYR